MFSVFMEFPSVQKTTVCFLFLLSLFLLFSSFSSVFLFVCLFVLAGVNVLAFCFIFIYFATIP